MSREEKLREIAEQEQALMREIYGFDNGVAWERERIIKLVENDYYHYLEITPSVWQDGKKIEESVTVHADDCLGCVLLALIKGGQQ